jgi:hypothetical protein
VNINSPRMFKNTFTTPFYLFATSSFCWQFCLLTMICPEFPQLADNYVVFFELIQRHIHCLVVRVWASERYTNTLYKQNIGVVRFKLYGVELTKLCLTTDSYVSTVSAYTHTPIFSPFSTFSYIPFLTYIHTAYVRVYIYIYIYIYTHYGYT